MGDEVFGSESLHDCTLDVLATTNETVSKLVDANHVWTYATDHLNSLFAELGLGRETLRKHNLAYYLKQV
jgi:hypothetical protein